MREFLKKRTIIAILLTIAVLFCLKDLYFIIKPKIFKFQISGTNAIDVQMQLSNDLKNFSNPVLFSQSYNLFKKNKVQIAKFKCANLLSRKYLKLSIRTAPNNQITLKNFKIDNDTLDITKFKSKDTTIKTNNDSLKVFAKYDTVDLFYDGKLDIKANLNFIWEVFVILAVLSFLLNYKLANYLADFKIEKRHSRLDICFLAIFFILLFIPMSKINQGEKSAFENKKLSTWKPLISDNNAINYNFGNNFNDWFNDRFNFKNELIIFNNNLQCKVGMKTCKSASIFFDLKNNFFYGSSTFGLAEIKKDKELIFKTYAKNVNKLQDFCNKNNIKLYFLISPRKMDFFTYDIPDLRKTKPDQADELIEYLKKHTKANFVYPKDEMKTANKYEHVYFKTDHHWTKYGVLIAYQQLMNEIKKDFPDVQILNEDSLETFYDNRVSAIWSSFMFEGASLKRFHLKEDMIEQILDTSYLYYKLPFEHKLNINTGFKIAPKEGLVSDFDVQFKYPNGIDKKILVIGNSFAQGLMRFIPFNFKESIYYHDNYRNLSFNVYQHSIEKLKPDILVINFETSYMCNLLNLFPNKYASKKGVE